MWRGLWHVGSHTLHTTILKQHLGCTFDSKVLSYQSDNLELIKRQQNHLSYTYPYPNTTLTAEFDLTKMIHMLHKDHKLPPEFCHVKVHQGCHKAYANLDLCAQLNFDANQLATAYYDHPEAYFDKQVLPLSSWPAQLSIAGVDVTINYKTILVQASTEPRYLEHLQNHFSWEDTVIKTLAWKSLSIALRQIHQACLCTKICAMISFPLHGSFTGGNNKAMTPAAYVGRKKPPTI